MIKTEDNYELIKREIQDKYSNLFIMSKLISDNKYTLTTEYIKFNIINLFFADEEEIDMGLPEIGLFIDTTDIKLQEWLRSKNISFTIREDMVEEDIAIEFQEFNIEDLQTILDIFDIINKYGDNEIVY